QIADIRRMLEALKIPVLTCENYEADDILATLALLVEEKGGECVLVTGDKDCRQLITERVRMYNIRKDQFYDTDDVMNDWGIRPDQVIDFQSLMGDDEPLSAGEMDDFEAFVATLTPPPNPFRNMDGSTANSFPNGGDPAGGETLFLNALLVVGTVTCNACHSVPTGTNGTVIQASALQETQSIKVPQLRNMYEKTGFSQMSSNNNRGFGFIHDGSIDTLFEFLKFPAFQFADDLERRHVEAFLMCFSTDTHAGVGVQATLPDAAPAAQPATVADQIGLAAGGAVGLVAKGLVGGEQRGYYLADAVTFQSDRATETISTAALMALAAPGAQITFTLVPAGSQARIGVDRDEDGFFDRDELDAFSDPADPVSTPDNVGDLNGDGAVNVPDLLILLAAWGPCPVPCPPSCAGDIDGDCAVAVPDLLILLAHWG
ncbi:MAG: hypothetical protein IH888_10970, partial [Planctomycetes bacterium]|nr:hypothetical protein [Planctomycetota bacterium]